MRPGRVRQEIGGERPGRRRHRPSSGSAGACQSIGFTRAGHHHLPPGRRDRTPAATAALRHHHVHRVTASPAVRHRDDTP
ncbi:hypothetical protein MINT15_26200 [Saccharomonospora viridis]|uniref:Uncharacterized protein n=1 Tax=Saccharomonospora viridis TaxID=1852 RepID=A0A837D6I7_9PSEU|nr:hypothetical protein MINT15_26200 [Saccharomonospora viridis]